MRAGSRRSVPIVGPSRRRSCRAGGSSASRRSTLQVVVELQEVLHDLGGGVAAGPGVVREGKERQLASRSAGPPGSRPGRCALLRASLGVKPTNQEWNGRRPWLSRSPNSAVPDLPATTIGRSTRLYVWRTTSTLRAATRIVAQVPGVDGQLADDLGLEALDDLALGVQHAPHELGAVERAAVGERRVGVDELDRRDHVEALADARLVRPRRGRRPGRSTLLRPLVGGDDARHLAGQVDAGLLAEAPLVGPVRQPVDAQPAGHLVEERVAGVGEAAVDVAGPRARLVPVPVLPCRHT